ncbi:PTS-dependent dihydroxyacetone kinase phosphotransferase subunit DhaM [Radiobacillus kanasensis]|uniref:dihydroxyacetone kinase phosphoryl donor subunit DhaM n=1 Tax=Radiobacillus kanasensis TaxID=2844358 RepID=UPI001E3670DE|nr:dihydroxyacetone kinase phosphoryl donor subunit DhaM [Radiobacillus kanasensis]UFT98610.1 PTS-dependent dihydroxyacetone kinase phosphotransferase subunit DhaM [Radiobacillus kanasensis]
MSHVGIVLISHSPKIADGIKDLISQVIKDVPIVAAGGTDENDIGTSFEKISNAIEEVYSEKGVLLFYDLGSALMNAEMAIEMSEHDNIRVAKDVALVEGAYVSAVEASMGKSLEEILESAKRAIAPTE